MGKLEVGFVFICLNDEFPASICGVYVEQDGHSISSVSLLSCHSCGVWGGLCFSGVSPDEPTAKTAELEKKTVKIMRNGVIQ